MTNWTKLTGAGALALLLATPALAQDMGEIDALDTDADGLLSMDEFGIGQEANFGMWDEDRDGMLSMDEWNAGSFGALDMNGDGFLDQAERARYMGMNDAASFDADVGGVEEGDVGAAEDEGLLGESVEVGD